MPCQRAGKACARPGHDAAPVAHHGVPCRAGQTRRARACSAWHMHHKPNANAGQGRSTRGVGTPLPLCRAPHPHPTPTHSTPPYPRPAHNKGRTVDYTAPSAPAPPAQSCRCSSVEGGQQAWRRRRRGDAHGCLAGGQGLTTGPRQWLAAHQASVQDKHACSVLPSSDRLQAPLALPRCKMHRAHVERCFVPRVDAVKLAVGLDGEQAIRVARGLRSGRGAAGKLVAALWPAEKGT